MTPNGGKARQGHDLAPSRRIGGPELEILYSRLYEPLTRGLGFRFHLTKEDASDIVHETFTLAVKRLSPKGNPVVWLTRVAYRLALNFVRTDARRADLLSWWGPHDPESLPEPDPPEDETEEDQ